MATVTGFIPNFTQTAYSSPPYASARAKSRANALQAELAVVQELDAVISAILRARHHCPEVFAEFKDEIEAAINQDPPEPEIQPPPDELAISSGDDGTGAERLVAFFRSRNNAPASIDEMATAIGRTKITVKVIVYKRHKNLFERIRQRGKNNTAYFRLAER